MPEHRPQMEALTVDEHRALEWAAEVMESRGLDGQAHILRLLKQRGYVRRIRQPRCTETLTTHEGRSKKHKEL